MCFPMIYSFPRFYRAIAEIKNIFDVQIRDDLKNYVTHIS